MKARRNPGVDRCYGADYRACARAEEGGAYRCAATAMTAVAQQPQLRILAEALMRTGVAQVARPPPPPISPLAPRLTRAGS